MNHQYLQEQLLVLKNNLNYFDNNGYSFEGIPFSQCQLLLHVGNTPGKCLLDIANAMNVDPSTISRTLDRIAKRGLIDRNENPEDRRTKLLTLTEDGEAFYHRYKEGETSFFRRIYDSISEEKKVSVMTAIKELNIVITTINKNCEGGCKS